MPKAPELTLVGALWAGVVGGVLYFGTLATYMLWHPAAIIFTGMILLVALWLIGGELVNKWLDGRK